MSSSVRVVVQYRVVFVVLIGLITGRFSPAAFPAVRKPGVFPVLKRGSRGPAVRLLQEAIRVRLNPSPKLAVDGVFGPETEKAVRQFQRQEGLAADGVVGTATWKALYRISVNDNVHTFAHTLAVLRKILERAQLETATITSGVRSPHDQARVMYYNIRRYGVESQKRLYGPYGDRVIDVYVANQSKPAAVVIGLMETEIQRIGPAKVSKHCSRTHDVIDVAPSTIGDRAARAAFEAALQWAQRTGLISRYIAPPKDPAYHIEIPRAETAGRTER